MTDAGDDAPSRGGFVDDTIRRMRVAAAAAGRGGAPGAAGSADPEALRAALMKLPPDDQRLLWETHVLRHEPSAVAAGRGITVRALTRALGPAEQRLASALAAVHAPGGPPDCAGTRESLEALVRREVPQSREVELEDHLDGCPACLHAYVGVREPAWALRDAGPRLAVSGWHPESLVATTAHRAPLPWRARRQSWLIVAGTVACVAVAAVAMALGSGDAAPAMPAAPEPVSSPDGSTVAVTSDGATSPAQDGPRAATSPGPAPGPSDEASPTGSPTPSPTDEDGTTPVPTGTSSTASPAPGDDDATTRPTSSATSAPRPTSPAPTPRPTGTATTNPSPSPDTPTTTAEPTDDPTTDPPAEPSPTATPTDEPSPTDPPEGDAGGL